MVIKQCIFLGLIFTFMIIIGCGGKTEVDVKKEPSSANNKVAIRNKTNDSEEYEKPVIKNISSKKSPVSTSNNSKNFDTLTKLMPKKQKYYLDKILDLRNKEQENSKTTNAFVKNETRNTLKINNKTLVEEFKQSCQNGDIDQWVGKISISSTSITVNLQSNDNYYFSLSFSNRDFDSPYKNKKSNVEVNEGMSKEIIDIVKKLNNGDIVYFSVSPLKKELSPSSGYSHKMPPESLKFLAPFSGK